MPVDSRRLPVPEDSKPLCMFVKDTQSKVKLVDNLSQRHDGRACNQTRPIFSKVGIVSQARGSAYIEAGLTKVLCAVYGPREVKHRDEFSLVGQLNCELKFATFSGVWRREHQEDSEEKEASLIVKEALQPAVRLDKFPKSRIDVFLMVLENNGSALSAAVSCASLALSNAAVEMFDLVVGSTISQFGSFRFVDPDSSEEYNSAMECLNSGTVTVGYLPSLGQISTVTQAGTLDLDSTKLCIEQCVEVSQRVYSVLRQCLVKAVEERAKTSST